MAKFLAKLVTEKTENGKRKTIFVGVSCKIKRCSNNLAFPFPIRIRTVAAGLSRAKGER